MNLPTSVHKIAKIALFPILLILIGGSVPQASSQANRELEITMQLDATDHNQSDVPKFRIELQNIGARDLILNLGFTLSNGSKQYPGALVLMIIDPQGKSRQFDLKGPAGVAGRLDPLILSLPIGSKFSLPVDLENYWAAQSKEFEYKFQRGRYSIQACFTGKAVSQQEANLDVKGIALMPYWTGTVTSKPLPFDIRK
jgi:hypothetical protein